jgi:hypothetical protein
MTNISTLKEQGLKDKNYIIKSNKHVIKLLFSGM